MSQKAGHRQEPAAAVVMNKMRRKRATLFKWQHFEPVMIAASVNGFLRYSLLLRDVGQLRIMDRRLDLAILRLTDLFALPNGWLSSKNVGCLG